MTPEERDERRLKRAGDRHLVRIAKAVTELENASFACGEWNSDSDGGPHYETCYRRAVKARAKLFSLLDLMDAELLAELAS